MSPSETFPNVDSKYKSDASFHTDGALDPDALKTMSLGLLCVHLLIINLLLFKRDHRSVQHSPHYLPQRTILLRLFKRTYWKDNKTLATLWLKWQPPPRLGHRTVNIRVEQSSRWLECFKPEAARHSDKIRPEAETLFVFFSQPLIYLRR